MKNRGLSLALLSLSLALLAACNRGKGGKGVSPAAETVASAVASATPDLGRLPTITVTAGALPSAAAPPTPSGPTPAPAPRLVNGLSVVDEAYLGVVREPGGLRIRSAPRIESGNVVGSVPEGAQVQVEGRVLNGQEGEPGKGTVWLIVGVNQYLYGAEGYVERVR